MIYTQTMLSLFRSHPAFSFMEENDAKLFLKCMDAEFAELKDGDVIWQGGEKAAFATFVLKGSVDRELPPLSTWEHIQSESGLSHSTIAVVAPQTQKASGDCTVIRFRVMRLLKPCNFQCPFHIGAVKNIG